jgi:hypothetical protein
MPNQLSLDRYKRERVAEALEELKDISASFEPGDEMMTWIDGQFETSASPLSKLFSESGLDRSKFESWKWLLWVLAHYHYQTNRDREELQFPEKRERQLLKDAADVREREGASGKRLHLTEVARKLKEKEGWKTKTQEGKEKEVRGKTKQLRDTAAKYRKLIVVRGAQFEDEFSPEYEAGVKHCLFVLSEKWRPSQAKLSKTSPRR